MQARLLWVTDLPSTGTGGKGLLIDLGTDLGTVLRGMYMAGFRLLPAQRVGWV